MKGAGRCFQIRGDYSTAETDPLGIHRQNFGNLIVALRGDRPGLFRMGDPLWIVETYILVNTLSMVSIE